MTRVRPAYTLLELLLVLAVIGIATALALPTLQTAYSDLRAKAAADTVRGAWAEARARAVNDGRPYRFSLVLEHGNYRVAPDSTEFWSGGPAPAADAGSAPLTLDAALPKGVRFRSVESVLNGPGDASEDTVLPPESVDSGAWSGTIIFLPDGTVRTEQDNVEIGIQAPNTRPLVVRMRSLTGVISVRPAGANGGRP